MWDKLLSKKRFYSFNKIEKDENEEFYRSSFHKDYDRVIFSSSFRRLSRKTQVHPLVINDNVHNRLTHSLEVASVGRSLGLQVGKFLKEKHKEQHINPYDVSYIVQTACLAHDIGNPPFGHAGEEVIKEWSMKNEKEEFLNKLSSEEIKDFLHLDGNAQSFRVVSNIENNLYKGGLNLTFATLGTLVKYPYSSSKCDEIGKSKFNYFKSEERFFRLLFKELGLEKQDGSFKRHPLSFLMEIADDICYGLLDLQDALELGMVRLDDVLSIFEKLCGKDKVKNIKKIEELTDSLKISKLIAYAINNLSKHTMEIFVKNYDIIIGDNQPKDMIEIFTNKDFKDGIYQAKNFAKKTIFNERRKIELEVGAYDTIETLLNDLMRANYQLYVKKDINRLSFRDQRTLALMGDYMPKIDKDLYLMHQRVLDYIISMTDNYAIHLSSQLDGMGY